MASNGPAARVLVLDGPATPVASLLRELVQARELIVTLARREFFARYRRASLGIAWAVALPLLQAAVLAVIFSKVAHLPLRGNAFVFVFSGMAPWSFFAAGLGAGATAIVDNAQLASKIYFPRLALPVVAVGANSYVAVLNLVVLLVATYASGIAPRAQLPLALVGLLLAVVLTVAAAALLAGLHVYFRDVRYLVQAGLLLAFYLTPVFYPLERTPTALRLVVRANPLTGVIDLYRAATIGAAPGWGVDVAVTLGWCAALSLLALGVHARHDRVFADLL